MDTSNMSDDLRIPFMDSPYERVEWKDGITSLSAEHLNRSDVAVYMLDNVLRDLIKNDITGINNTIGGINDTIDGLNTAIPKINDNIDEINNTITGINTNITETSNNVSSLQKSVDNLANSQQSFVTESEVAETYATKQELKEITNIDYDKVIASGDVVILTCPTASDYLN